MAIERLVEPTAAPGDTEEERIEISLRPVTFDEYIGQEHLKNNIRLAIDAVKKRNDGSTLDHVLLYGPPGLGKTTMAGVIAHELGASLRVTSGPAIERAGDLASILTNLKDGDVLFIDEIHRLRRAVEEVLYSAMEDYKLDIVIGKGPGARSVRLDLPKFTVIGATTRTGSLAGPLRDNVGGVEQLYPIAVDSQFFYGRSHNRLVAHEKNRKRRMSVESVFYSAEHHFRPLVRAHNVHGYFVIF